MSELSNSVLVKLRYRTEPQNTPSGSACVGSLRYKYKFWGQILKKIATRCTGRDEERRRQDLRMWRSTASSTMGIFSRIQAEMDGWQWEGHWLPGCNQYTDMHWSRSKS